ncbi:MAG TPA: hypothetical protein V6C72_18370 [Chroococcales cyanobacterium]
MTFEIYKNRFITSNERKYVYVDLLKSTGYQHSITRLLQLEGDVIALIG